jgi:hypothetical protein
MSFESEYQSLLIKQYWEKPKASAEIELQASTWNRIFEWLQSFGVEFDLDTASGDRLDIIGRILGLGRVVDAVIDKVYFGFFSDPNAATMGDRFLGPLESAAPFADRFQQNYTALQLNDNDYRLFLKIRAAKNYSSGFMISGEKIGIQDVINTAFNGRAYIIDNQDMTLSLYLGVGFDLNKFRAIESAGLLPKPQGVRINLVERAAPLETFGFSDNPNAQGFADKFNPSDIGGTFSLKVIS